MRLTSRAAAPVRGEALYAPGSAQPLFDLRAPIVFASTDPELHPVRYNEKPYRGRLEVFANTKGALTVVNVITLEDYVRGVVPNELSPGGWPELEALKAQAVAARTYAVSNLGRFGFGGLRPHARHALAGLRRALDRTPLTDRAVLETRGRIATYKGAPDERLLHLDLRRSHRGRREHLRRRAHPIPPRPRVRARRRTHFASSSCARLASPPHQVGRAHDERARRRAARRPRLRPAARLGEEWLASNVTAEEVRVAVPRLAALARQTPPNLGADATRPGGFATALALALDGESRGATLLNSADVEYLLAFRDASEVPQQNRADVAAMLREGHLALLPEGTLRPRQPLTRARALRSIAHALESRGLAAPTEGHGARRHEDALLLRPASGKGRAGCVAAGRIPLPRLRRDFLRRARA